MGNKILFIGGPDDGKKLEIDASRMNCHIPYRNKAGRLLMAVYHKDVNKDCFIFSHYVNNGKHWRED